MEFDQIQNTPGLNGSGRVLLSYLSELQKVMNLGIRLGDFFCHERLHDLFFLVPNVS